MSLIKGVDKGPDGLKLISDYIREGLRGAVPVSVLMGANVANEVARDELCESTVSRDRQTDRQACACREADATDDETRKTDKEADKLK